MESGGTHKHVGIIDIHKYAEYSDAFVANGLNYQQKFTKSLLLVTKAFPVHVDGDPSTALTSACPFRIDILVHYKVKWRRVPLPKKKDQFVQNSVTILPGPYAYQQKDADPEPTGSGEV